ncbi:MAG: transporter substrate-binding domain-containing protein [Phyllobacterium sp.]
MNFFKKICAAVAATIAIGASSGSAGTIDDIRSRGTLRVAGILNELPYFAKDPRSGEWKGLVIDMANDIAKSLDVKVEIVESSWANAILDVQSGKVDLSFAATATPQRALSVQFSEPTYFNSFVIVSAKDELEGKSWNELNDPKYTFAVDIGSSQDLITHQYLPKANVLRFKTRDEAIIAVTTGKADALVNTLFNGLVMSKKAPALGTVKAPTPFFSTPSSVAMNYNSEEQWKSFVSTWANYNRRSGSVQTWILKSLEPFGVTEADFPKGFSLSN